MPQLPIDQHRNGATIGAPQQSLTSEAFRQPSLNSSERDASHETRERKKNSNSLGVSRDRLYGTSERLRGTSNRRRPDVSDVSEREREGGKKNETLLVSLVIKSSSWAERERDTRPHTHLRSEKNFYGEGPVMENVDSLRTTGEFMQIERPQMHKVERGKKGSFFFYLSLSL